MRRLLPLVVLAATSCGVINGSSGGEYRSPWYLFFEPSGGACEETFDWCNGSGQLCDWDTGECGLPDETQRGCSEAEDMGTQDDDGPLIYDASLSTSTASTDGYGDNCVYFSLGYEDLSGNHETLTDVETVNGLEITVDDTWDVSEVEFDSDADRGAHYIDGYLCGDNAPPQAAAFRITTPDGAGSNTVCAANDG
jgi:hypothetical protein